MDSNNISYYFDQSITIQTLDGPTDIPMADLNDFVLYNAQICINYGAQIGASIVLLVALLLLTKPDKRRSAIFVANTSTLLLNIVRTVLHAQYYTGPFSNVYAYFGQDYRLVPRSSYASSVTTTVFEWLVLASLETSLCLQVHVVCVTLRDIHRRTILILSILVAWLALGFRTALMIKNSALVMQHAPEDSLLWLNKTTSIMTAVSICWFCAIFITKLGFALHQRRKLGMGQFGPMQIILIMGCQTLIIPALFSILQFFVQNPAMASNVATAVAVFLPLSSLWASASLDSRYESSREARYRQGNGYGADISGSAKPVSRQNSAANAADTSIDASVSANERLSPSTLNALGEHGTFRDLEAQGLVKLEQPEKTGVVG